ncbi:tRNA pseudouridine(55) synthase TruB [Paraglaciecola hydrolytica]|uniref:tRNA pseudouridine synthase B n=1 Tax=Paraglaciecola hydrolytica TaxID=1799789 RepID=A0A148KNE8_9ALTE|nr:tRNA pseudouridine(55) synthase TruB [Paraglaciecola hydrolytica]KXI27758.1 pseudouridine synthase [Paraglaciecola hydrolytica]
MAKKRKGRLIDGIFLLNKSLDISSNQAMQKVRWAFGAAKAGHTGALDPLATGMLPVCLGEATKFSQFLLDTDKTYQVTAKLGVRTTTSDAAGEVVETKEVNVTAKQFAQACEQFRGPIKQVPSMFSALKHQGKPLYTYARQGIDIPREARAITIFSLSIDRFDGDEVDMTVHCSKGTYIRSLVDDIGQVLGCGAYVSKLHRTKVTDYPSDKMLTLEQLDVLVSQAKEQGIEVAELLDPLLLPMDTAVKGLAEVTLSAEQVVYYNNGNSARLAVSSSSTAIPGEQVRVYAPDTHLFLGVGIYEEGNRVQPKRVVVRESA